MNSEDQQRIFEGRFFFVYNADFVWYNYYIKNYINTMDEINIFDVGVEKSKMNRFLTGTQLAGKAWRDFLKSWRVYVMLSLPMFFLQLIFAAVLVYTSEYVPGSPPIIALLYSLYMVLLGVISILWSITLILTADASGEMTFKNAYNRALKLFFPYLWVSILAGLVIYGGFIFFVIPGIVLSILFSVSFMLVLFESERGVAVLIKSREYIRGYGMQVFWRYFVLGA